MICSSLNRLFLTSPPRPWRAILTEKSHFDWATFWGARQNDKGRYLQQFVRGLSLVEAIKLTLLSLYSPEGNMTQAWSPGGVSEGTGLGVVQAFVANRPAFSKSWVLVVCCPMLVRVLPFLGCFWTARDICAF
jgi:hypothetical protein